MADMDLRDPPRILFQVPVLPKARSYRNTGNRPCPAESAGPESSHWGMSPYSIRNAKSIALTTTPRSPSSAPFPSQRENNLVASAKTAYSSFRWINAQPFAGSFSCLVAEPGGQAV